MEKKYLFIRMPLVRMPRDGPYEMDTEHFANPYLSVVEANKGF